MDRTVTHLSPSRAKRANPDRAMPGLAWSPLDGLLVSHGVTRSIPVLEFDPAAKAAVHKQDRTINPERVSIWTGDRSDPFEDAGAWRLNNDGSFDVLRDDFFQRVGDRKVNFIEDYMGPFFARVAENIRRINPDWILFAELDPLSGFFGPGFPGRHTAQHRQRRPLVRRGHARDQDVQSGFQPRRDDRRDCDRRRTDPGALRTPARQDGQDVRDDEWRRAHPHRRMRNSIRFERRRRVPRLSRRRSQRCAMDCSHHRARSDV